MPRVSHPAVAPVRGAVVSNHDNRQRSVIESRRIAIVVFAFVVRLIVAVVRHVRTVGALAFQEIHQDRRRLDQLAGPPGRLDRVAAAYKEPSCGGIGR